LGEYAYFLGNIFRGFSTVSVAVVISVGGTRVTSSIIEFISVTTSEIPHRGKFTSVNTVLNSGSFPFSMPHNLERVLAHTRVVDTSPARQPTISVESYLDWVATFPSSPGDSIPTKSDVGLGGVGGAIGQSVGVRASLDEAHLGNLRNSQTSVSIRARCSIVAEVRPSNRSSLESKIKGGWEMSRVSGGTRNIGV